MWEEQVGFTEDKKAKDYLKASGEKRPTNKKVQNGDKSKMLK